MWMRLHDKVRPPMHQLMEKRTINNVSPVAVVVSIKEDHTLKLFRGPPSLAFGKDWRPNSLYIVLYPNVVAAVRSIRLKPVIGHVGHKY